MTSDMKKQSSFPGFIQGRKTDPQEITLYGKGAGLYSYLNMLAQLPETFDKKPFELHS